MTEALAPIRPADARAVMALPGCRLTHHLNVVAGRRPTTLAAILHEVEAAGAGLGGLVSLLRDDRFDHELRLTDIQPEAAVRLSQRLAGLPDVRHTAIEHRFVRMS